MARRTRAPALADFPEDELVRTLVWELPVRVAHWVTFGAVVVLTVTGLYLHRPFISWRTATFLVAWFRFAHIVAGFVLIASLTVRVYWMFRGNFWARWTAFLPVHAYQWRDLWTTLEFYAFLRFRPKPRLGHNALAALAYLAIYVLLIVEALTGLALLVHLIHTPALNELLGWLAGLAPIEWMRALHSFQTWIFIAFTIFHVYLCVLISLEERNGLLDSIFSGYKFVPARELRAEVLAIPEARRYEKRPVALPARPPTTAAPARPAAPGPTLLFHNWLSYAGAALAGAGLVVFFVLLLYHTVGGGAVRQPYGDLVVFLGVPIVIVVGVVLVLVGMYAQWLRWRWRKPLWYPRYPHWDLNLAADRRALLVLAASGILVLGTVAFTGVGAYVYTDSSRFCATLCHTMEPERVTYGLSEHAHVECAACHIGEGAQGWVAAKTRGVYELYSNMAGIYPRPIPTPVVALRPVAESCTRCHWPGARLGTSLTRFVHFLSDERNTRWEIDLAVPVGAGRVDDGPAGVHWHVAARVEYVVSDDARQHIPWVRSVDPATGVATVFTSSEEPPQAKPDPRTGSVEAPLVMTCIDCHTRPAHVLEPPTTIVDRALAAGEMDPSLPWIRREGVRALSAKYGTREAAHQGIAESVRDFYREEHPELLARSGAAIDRAVGALVAGYDRNFFPAMNARWDSYRSNDGHLIDPGCFRCHDGKHASAAGELIPNDCDTCHTIVRQGTPDKPERGAALAFNHPVDVGTQWIDTACTDCHNGGAE